MLVMQFYGQNQDKKLLYPESTINEHVYSHKAVIVTIKY